MRTSFSVLCVCVLLVGVLLSCTAPDKQAASTVTEESTKSALQVSAAPAKTTPEGTQYQYRAVCLEKAAHGGNEQVLSTWLDSKDEAMKLGQYHGDFKKNGHRWRIEERVKP